MTCASRCIVQTELERQNHKKLPKKELTGVNWKKTEAILGQTGGLDREEWQCMTVWKKFFRQFHLKAASATLRKFGIFTARVKYTFLGFVLE